MDVRRIEQRDQHVDVEKCGHGSSRRRFTNSGVTSGPRFRLGRVGTPLRFCEAVVRGVSAVRASSEMMFPAVVPRRAAICFAVSSTSSSMSSVVRMEGIITHHASGVKGGRGADARPRAAARGAKVGPPVALLSATGGPAFRGPRGGYPESSTAGAHRAPPIRFRRSSECSRDAGRWDRRPAPFRRPRTCRPPIGRRHPPSS